jgi:5-methyltetrahydrofolate--homocysteine methyltransferase
VTEKNIYPIQKRLQEKAYLLADGATGTELIKMGVLKKGVSPEQLLLDSPESFIKIHRSYYEAGSDYVVCNSFGASVTKLEEWGLEKDLVKINKQAVSCCRQALKESGKKAFIAASIGPTGRLLYPVGTSSMEELIKIYTEQVKILFNEGVDLFVLETMTDMREAKSAYIAIRDLCDLPIGVCLSFEANGRTLFNNTPESFAVTFDASDVMFLGANCSVGPKEMTQLIQRMGEYTEKPLIIKPNAGVGDIHYSINDFTKELDTWVSSGCSIFGGCCGTDPEYIKAIDSILSKKKIKKQTSFKSATHLSSMSKVVSLGRDLPLAIIGERINPTNKKQMIEELGSGKLDMVTRLARQQLAEGAHLLDINLGAAGVDQNLLMKETFALLSTIVDAPLVVDSSSTQVIESALRAYGAKALINSTTADKDKAEKIFELAHKYGAGVIALTMNKQGIPMQAEQRMELAKTILDIAKKKGVKPRDIIIDTLTLSLSSNQKEAMETIKALKMVDEELGVSTVLGVSNVSYGLPARAGLNQAFLSIAINAGLNAAIINPSSSQARMAIDAMNVISGHDAYGIEYIKKYSETNILSNQSKAESDNKKGTNDLNARSNKNISKDPISELMQAIIEGDEDASLLAINKAIDSGLDLLDIANKALIPAIEVVGKYFKDGKYFLPQVVLSAQSMKRSFEVLRSKGKNEKPKFKARILMATVEGDIHDIGKNIVITLLETNGFEVFDLGKSVPSEDIIKKTREFEPDIIGLSALMTTTMEEMAIVIEELKKNKINTPVMVGGAVITQDFADSIGAKYYAKDAMHAVEILNTGYASKNNGAKK